MLLLLAISSCKERYEVFQNYERLADGLEMEPGWSVTVRHPQAGEINGMNLSKALLVKSCERNSLLLFRTKMT